MALIQNPKDRFWRTDYQLGRNIYALLSNDEKKPSRDDELIGTMESSELAESVVETHNLVLRRYGRHYSRVLSGDVENDT